MCAGLVGEEAGSMGGSDTGIGVFSQRVHWSRKRMGGSEPLLFDSEVLEGFWLME